ncbi:MAG: 30S ribosomal protein S17 [Candidatus Marinimicrobia bacterium]|jgi:small subunit ribosomal protein S17|nr:30S ribosomal protein S17 [Candidatus Neomarinimicrobiota bacterium]MBT3945791.1 30S ribosomal protein S17 [Candidatus Neomarinimicrobiota bacterium]MBT4155467.1 30S ribosomal protein S17 [Candidatus Neomarinimicrobiota bacterium]MBT4555257.1 30S ribosomal protein S17 [Candidatus Neomarinimicrobiota bacterium]MBT4752662.1 30S ribosomal protein S17 [Candidatus Neomarinimicrobiota bacterium]|tara:strand:- start:26608 stop:26874 length:267 start_codon:yes stop_codon:yes gene_type:complete
MSLERRRQSLIGEVISTKMEKTVNVKVMREISHPIYHKRVKRFKNYLAHVASVTPKDGDIVKITAIKPMSKRKRWQVSEIIRESVKLG